MKKILLVAGARPNFMKIAPILREIGNHDDMRGILCHTGQHYDANMSELFFENLGIRSPDYNLEVGSGTHAFQTAHIMMRFEPVCEKEKPDAVVVVGDVNSTIATGLVATKLHIPLAHVEAGLRSGDRRMPEEINRIATDAITDLFFTTEKAANRNLLREGHDRETIHFVGHVMIDNLLFQLGRLDGSVLSKPVREMRSRLPDRYICLTLHRPSNVDNRETLEKLLTGIRTLSEKCPVIFPCHPRTKKRIEEFGLSHLFSDIPGSGQAIGQGFLRTDPLGYDDFLYVWKDAALVITDSGGLQEETTALKIPCITLRKTTERPITAEIGSNHVIGDDTGRMISLGNNALAGKWKSSEVPELWDGRAGERIVAVLRGERETPSIPLKKIASNAPLIELGGNAVEDADRYDT